MTTPEKKVLDYQIIKYYKFSDPYILLLYLFNLVFWFMFFYNFNETDPQKEVPLWQVILITIILNIAIKYLSKYQEKKINFYNNLIIISKKYLEDPSLANYHRIIANSATTIIDYRLKTYNKEIFDKKNQREIDQPYAISYGEYSTYEIAKLTTDSILDKCELELTDFNYEEFKLLRDKATNFEKATESSLKRRAKNAEYQSFLTGKNDYDILMEQEDEYEQMVDERNKKLEEDKIKRQEKIYQIASGSCPYCFKKVHRLARKCPHCTADL